MKIETKFDEVINISLIRNSNTKELIGYVQSLKNIDEYKIVNYDDLIYFLKFAIKVNLRLCTKYQAEISLGNEAYVKDIEKNHNYFWKCTHTKGYEIPILKFSDCVKINEQDCKNVFQFEDKLDNVFKEFIENEDDFTGTVNLDNIVKDKANSSKDEYYTVDELDRICEEHSDDLALVVQEPKKKFNKECLDFMINLDMGYDIISTVAAYKNVDANQYYNENRDKLDNDDNYRNYVLEVLNSSKTIRG